MRKLSQPISSFTSQHHSMVIIWQTTNSVSLYRKPCSLCAHEEYSIFNQFFPLFTPECRICMIRRCFFFIFSFDFFRFYFSFTCVANHYSVGEIFERMNGKNQQWGCLIVWLVIGSHFNRWEKNELSIIFLWYQIAWLYMAVANGLTRCNDIRYQHKKDQE